MTLIDHDRRRQPITLRWSCSCGWLAPEEDAYGARLADWSSLVEVERHRADEYRVQRDELLAKVGRP